MPRLCVYMYIYIHIYKYIYITEAAGSSAVLDHTLKISFYFATPSKSASPTAW